MNALDKLFARLAELLPVETVAALRDQYRRDAAADSVASRQRAKAQRTQRRQAYQEVNRQNVAARRRVASDEGADGGEGNN